LRIARGCEFCFKKCFHKLGGMKKAIVALARRLAVIIHRMRVDGTEFRWSRETAAA
jgi:hypothetical protein